MAWLVCWWFCLCHCFVDGCHGRGHAYDGVYASMASSRCIGPNKPVNVRNTYASVRMVTAALNHIGFNDYNIYASKLFQVLQVVAYNAVPAQFLEQLHVPTPRHHMHAHNCSMPMRMHTCHSKVRNTLPPEPPSQPSAAAAAVPSLCRGIHVPCSSAFCHMQAFGLCDA